MTTDTWPTLDACNCLALRQAARHVTQLYDQMLVPSGLRATQFSVLLRLRRRGPLGINALAGELVMDRTTLGHAIQPLKRDGLIDVAPGRTDRRSRVLKLTDSGRAKLRQAIDGWIEAQTRFEAVFGVERAQGLRALLHTVSAGDFVDAASPAH